MISWKVGDVVQLKSGSPKMTVQWVNEEGDVRCQWFDRFDAKSEAFRAESLKLATESED